MSAEPSPPPEQLQQADRLGRVSIMALFNYVMRKVWLHQTRIGLSLYDITGQGFLRESDLGKLHQPLNSTLNHQILLIWPVLRVPGRGRPARGHCIRV